MTMTMKFSKKFKHILKSFGRYRYIVCKGGRGGGKSWQVAMLILIWGTKYKLRVCCAREYQKNLEESVYRLMGDVIRMNSSLGVFYRIMSDKIIAVNGTEIFFTGIKNAKNFKSFEGADILWVEEGQTISQNSLDVAIPTIRRENSLLIFTFNPENESDPIYDFVLNPRDKQKTLTINYDQNPFISKTLLDAIEEDRKHKTPEDFNWIWLGQCKTLSRTHVFRGRFRKEYFEIEYKNGIPYYNNEIVLLRYGLDFGWTNPSVMIECFKVGKVIYIYNEIGGQHLDNDDLTRLAFANFPCVKYNNITIYGDSEDPLRINTLKSDRISKNGEKLRGINILPAKKEKGSVKAGVDWLLTHDIIIHPQCKMVINDFDNYKYKVDGKGNILDEFDKHNDHACDAVRYAFNDVIGLNAKFINWEEEYNFKKEMIA